METIRASAKPGIRTSQEGDDDDDDGDGDGNGDEHIVSTSEGGKNAAADNEPQA